MCDEQNTYIYVSRSNMNMNMLLSLRGGYTNSCEK